MTALALHARGVDVARYGVALLLCATPPRVAANLLAELAASSFPDAADLASLIPDKRIDKYDDVIGESLLTRSYAARKLDVPGTEQAITTLADQAAPVQAAQAEPPVVAAVASCRHRLGSLPYAVVDVETTSTDARKARIVEIAIIRLHPDGSDDRLYSTIVDPGTGPGPTHIHGLTAGDLAGAPRFAE
ncbi:exonuclease domain-containing protein, partial [Streptosporangium sp. G11]|uniref:exonuclease domain-containing protein n=1 Tax=Streptosporangium sp. G11 TaxID=3436926 RepID=UPI003EBC35EF